MTRDPKSTAAAALALGGEDRGGDPPAEDELDETEEAALEAAADEVLAAVEAKDSRALMGALRSAFRSMKR